MSDPKEKAGRCHSCKHRFNCGEQAVEWMDMYYALRAAAKEALEEYEENAADGYPPLVKMRGVRDVLKSRTQLRGVQ